MDSVKEYLDKLEINNTILSKQLKEVYIQKVVYFKEDKIVYFYLTSKDIVSYELLDKFWDELLYTLDYFKDIRVKIRYTGLDRKTNKDIIKRYWNNILYILKSLCPAIEGWYKKVEYMCLDDVLKIKLPKDLFYEKLMRKNVIHVLKTALSEELGIDINIVLERAIDENISISKIIERTDREIEEKIKALDFGKVEEKEVEEEGYVIKPEVDEHLIYGENVNVIVDQVSKLNVNSGTTGIIGEVFDIETKELRNGKILLILAVTDYTSSISCKLFLNDVNKDGVLNEIKKGSYLKIKGDIIYEKK